MTQSAKFRDHFRDPLGWLLDALPWPMRRMYVAAHLRDWPPDACRLIGFRRPPRCEFESMRRLLESEETTS